MSRRRRLAYNFALAAAVLLVLEGVARLYEFNPKFRWSAELGYELVPGFRDDDETINSFGLRGPEPRFETPELFRILCLGGSTTFCTDVPDDASWPAALERDLRAAGCDEVEVFNGGVSGYGLEQNLVALRSRLLDELHPDLVLVYSGWNRATIAGSPTIAKYLRKAQTSREKTGIYHSALARQIARKLEKWDPYDRHPDDIDRVERQENTDRLMDQAFPPLVAEMAALCRDRGVALCLIRYPSLIQATPEDLAQGERFRERYRTLLHHDKYQSLDYDELVAHARHQWSFAGDVIARSAAAAGVPVLDLAGAMQPDRDEAGFELWIGWWADRMHLTVPGCEGLARALAGVLIDQVRVPGPPDG